MLTSKKILHLFQRLNDELAKEGIYGEIGLVGGAAMALAYKAREATKDVDAIFEPTAKIRELAKRLAKEEDLSSNWLNDAVKGFLAKEFKRNTLLELSHLKVWVPEEKYMLAMKCISARWDTSDRNDVIFLIKRLKLKKPEEVFEIIESYYPKSQIPSKTKFFIEEIIS